MDHIKATDDDIQNKRFHIDIEALINSTAESLGISNKEYLEELYLKGTGLKRADGEVVWEDDKIIGFKPYKSCEYISVKVTIDKNSTKLEL